MIVKDLLANILGIFLSLTKQNTWFIFFKKGALNLHFPQKFAQRGKN